MKRKVLFFGDLYHAEASLVAEMEHSDDFIFETVVDRSSLSSSYYVEKKCPYSNLPHIFKATILETQDINKATITKIIDQRAPDYVLVRCWTSFATVDIPDSIFWKIESMHRKTRGESLEMLFPSAGAIGFLTQNKEEIGAYAQHLFIPVGYFPRGVSHFWEKPQNKTFDVMAATTLPDQIPTKITSAELLIKPLCENLPIESVHIYINHGRELVPWAVNNFKPCYFAEEGPKIMAQARIFVSPVTTRYDPGIFSHKTLQAMACRTLTITQYYDGLEDIVGQSGENLIYVKSAEECLDKVKYYLKHEKEREEIADRGYRFIHSEYNYTKVFKRAMKQIGLYEKD